MYSNTSSVCKIASVILGIAGTVFSVLTGIGGGSFLLFLFLLIPCAVLCLVLFAAGEVLDRIDAVSQYQQQIFVLLKGGEDIPPDFVSNAGLDLHKAAAASRAKQSKWVCANCQAWNEESSLFCKECGAHK